MHSNNNKPTVLGNNILKVSGVFPTATTVYTTFNTKASLTATKIHINQHREAQMEEHKRKNMLYVTTSNVSTNVQQQAPSKAATLKRDVIMLQQNYVTSNNNNIKAHNIERTVSNDGEIFCRRKPTLFSQLTSSDADESQHVLNIKISPGTGSSVLTQQQQQVCDRKVSIISINQDSDPNKDCARANMVQNPIFENGFNSLSDNKERLNSNSDSGNSTKTNNSNSSSSSNSFYISGTQGNLKVMSSGHCSPTDDHLDSGTCSDAELNLPTSSPLPPPLPPKKMGGHSIHHLLSDSISSDDSVCSLSSDSLSYHVSTTNTTSSNTNNKHTSILGSGGSQLLSPELIKSLDTHQKSNVQKDFDAKRRPLALLPSSLLKDIRNHSLKFNLNDVNYLQDRSSASSDEEVDELDDLESNYSDCNNIVLVNQSRNYELNIKFNHMQNVAHNNNHALIEDNNNFYENDKFYKFHINEHLSNSLTDTCQSLSQDIDESFAGIKDINSGTSTIRSSKGTVRGVKNRVRNGIATFLQMQQTTVKNYKDKDAGKVVVYTTSMGIVRSTYAKCQSVKQILRTLLVKFEERDVYMSNEYQDEVKDRMLKDEIDIPQLFVNGQHIGNADKVERLNETGELRKMLKQFKCFDSVLMCKICGGYKLLPCPSCGGSKKSIHRNHFTAEFINLRCMNCDEVGLIKCYNC